MGRKAAAAVVPAAQDQEVVISQIMLSLQPAIDAAIDAALAGSNTVTTVTVEESTGPVSFSGTLGDTSYEGSFQSQQSSFNSNSVSSSLDNDLSQQFQQQQQFSTVPVSISGSQTGNVASNVGSNQASSVSTTSDSQRVQLGASTAKRVQQQKIVSAVIGSLTPSIEEAVMNALMANMATTQTQSSFSSTSTQSDAGFTSTSVSSSSSSSSEQVLITRIIEALTPSITAAVRKALQERYEAQQAALLFQQQQAAAFQASQQAQQSSSVSLSDLFAQIIAAL